MNKTSQRDVADEALTFDVDLPDPPEKVWRALTVPELREAWILPDGVEAKPGNPASSDAAGAPTIECEVLEADPFRSLRLAWRETDTRSDSVVDSVVTFALARTVSGGTHLRIVHDGFVAAAARPAVAIAGTDCRLSIRAGRPKTPPVAANGSRPLMRAA
jgi:uncharacterized protein YndB with AHSA1/START domain